MIYFDNETFYKTKYDGYYVSKTGRLFSTKSNKILAMKYDKDGYVEYRLSVDGKNVYRRGHRIVLETFVGNPENKPTVNHKNGIKDDNRLENLEWATYSENNFHRMRVLGHDLDTAIKYLINNKIIVSKEQTLKKLTSREYVDCLNNDIEPRLRYVVLEKEKDKTITAYHNGEAIHCFKNNEEAAAFYKVAKNTISSKIHRTLTENQYFTRNNVVKRLSN